MRFAFLILLLLVLDGELQSQVIHPLQKCFACHNGKTDAPFDWTNDKESFRHKKLIISAINTGLMPPWHTDTSFVRFQNEIILTESEKKAIENFLLSEKTLPKKAALKAKFHDESHTKITVAMNKPYIIPPHENDIFTWFQSNFFLKDTIRIGSISIKSDNKRILHHCEVFSSWGQPVEGAQKSLPKKSVIISDTSFVDSSSAFKDAARLVAGRFSGIANFDFPEGFSMWLYPQEHLLYYVHYSPSLIVDNDSSWIEFLLENKHTRQIKEYGIHAFQSLLNPPFVIKKDSVKTFYCSKIVDDTISVFSVYPHAHHLCQNMLAYAVTPQGDTIHLIKIDKWQFHWKWHYNYEHLVIIPKGSTIFLQATYDNTTKNIDNPNNPPKDAALSFNSNDEMMTLFLYYASYKKEDENKKLVWRN